MSNELIKSKALKDVIQTDGVKNRLREIMGARAPQFAAALVQLVGQSHQLQKCDPNSVIGAALTAAALDLSIDPNLGEAHVVPYKDRAVFQVGYVGYGQLAQRSAMYKNLGWCVIHEGELIRYDELSGEFEYRANNPDGPVIGYAAKFKLVNGFERAEYWTTEKIEAHAMRYSQSYRYCKGKKDKEGDCRWIADRDRMALKTVLKSLLRTWGPKSIAMQKALKVDEGAIIDADAETVDFIDNPSELKSAEPVFDSPPPPPAEKLKPAKKAPEPPMAKPVVEQPEKEPESFEAAAESPTSPAPVSVDTKVKNILTKMALSKISEERLIKFLHGMNVIDADVTTLVMVSEKAGDVLDLISDQWIDIAARIRTTVTE